MPLHGLESSSAFMYPQFQDPLLNQRYNLISFDLLGNGDTEAPLYLSDWQAPYHDGWVEAVILARFCDALELPPVHLFASQSRSVQGAGRFAALFPDKCKSR